MISVDRDTSTNDMAVILANGLVGNPVINDVNSDDYKLFQEALQTVAVTLAKMIARDGEGAYLYDRSAGQRSFHSGKCSADS